MSVPLADFSNAAEAPALTPEAQDSIIPRGWKPTVAEPVPVVRCVQVKKDGERCGRWSLRGYTKCYYHSGKGNFTNVNEYVAAVIEAARLRLVGNTDEAVNTLEQLMQPGTADSVRLKAATEILDRSGIRGGWEVSVEQTDNTNPADVLLNRISKLSSNAQAAMGILNGAEDIVDAEEVEESDQLELF